MMLDINVRKEQKEKRFWKYFMIVFVVRVVGYLYILIDPIVGVLLAMALDVLDCWFMGIGGFSRYDYHRMDKPIDYIQYLVMFIPVWGTPIFIPYAVTLIYRTIGQLLYKVYFSKTKFNRRIYLLFPNMAEYIFLVYFLSERFNLGVNMTLWWPYAVILGFKLVQEWYLHSRDDDSSFLLDFGYACRPYFGLREIQKV